MTDETVDDNPDDKKMPLMEHLIELRRRLIWSLVAFVVCFVIASSFANPIFDFLTRPLGTIWEGQEGRHLIYTALQEKFFANVKVAMFGGLVLAFPIIASQVWGFVAPGLYKNEKVAFLPFLIATPIMFIMGASFVYYIFIPNAFRFFASFEEVAHDGALAITAEPKVSEYLDLIIQLILGFGIVFELPVLLTLLVSAELLEAKTLAKQRRYAVVARLHHLRDPDAARRAQHDDDGGAAGRPLRNLDRHRPDHRAPPPSPPRSRGSGRKSRIG
jgi:sec-independent protein translocase protein TatC